MKNRKQCKLCSLPVKSKGKVNGVQRWSVYCHSHHEAVYSGKKVWVLHKKDKCELCGFVAINQVQLDVDHIDGNKDNNDPKNLQTLCANCHRLKTYLNKDWEMREDDFVASQLDLFT